MASFRSAPHLNLRNVSKKFGTRLNPYIAVASMGVAYSLLASALWPIAALIIPEYQLGTAYGLMQVKN